MCHLILLLPVVTIPLFWITPLATAVPVYSVILLGSAGLYFATTRAMQWPAETGSEGLIQATGQVIRQDDDLFHVRVYGELWYAESEDRLEPGDFVTVTGVSGLTLAVSRMPKKG